ncbi:MAG: biotin/lipoyl-containing protein, partial [Myxococcales bacterium]
MATQEVTVPDIGDFKDVPVIQVFVKPGDEVKKEDPLVSLESDKATMDVPSPADGKVKEVKLKVGDKVSKGSAILVLETAEAGPSKEAPAPAAAPAKKAPESAAQPQRPAQPQEPAKPAPAARPAPPAPAAGPAYRGQVDVEGAMLVIGSGPGGYSAAFRAADLGLEVVLVERYERLGGVCLNVGCIPSKALLHVAKVLADAHDAAEQGIAFGNPAINLDGVRTFKDGAVGRLTGGLVQLAKGRNVRVVHGEARFTGPHELTVGDEAIAFA